MHSTARKMAVAALVTLVFGPTGMAWAADSCPLQVKNCIPNSEGTLKVEAYNGNDDSHRIPATETGRMTWGQSASLSCNYSNCDLRFRVYRADGSEKGGLPFDDQCGSVTFQRTPKPFDDPMPYAFEIHTGIQTCRYQ